MQWAHVIAPAAKIDLVLAKTNHNTDLVSAIKFAVDHNLGDQMAGHRLGFINNTLYQIGRFDVDDLHDITVGNNSVQEPDSTGTLVSVAGFNAHKGWDATTGLGTPRVNQLIPLLVALKSDRDDENAAASFVMN